MPSTFHARCFISSVITLKLYRLLSIVDDEPDTKYTKSPNIAKFEAKNFLPLFVTPYTGQNQRKALNSICLMVNSFESIVNFNPPDETLILSTLINLPL